MNDFFQIVIIKSYNDENSIERCIKSVLAQDNYHQLRVYIIDDCSTDNTKFIIKKYKKFFYKIEIRKKNLGANYNVHDYNKILKNYKNGYIIILSGDDYMPLSRTKEHERVFLNHDIGFHFGIGYSKNLKNEVLNKFPNKSSLKDGLVNQDFKIYEELIDHNYIPSYAGAYSIKYLNKINGFQNYPENNISIDLSTIFFLSNISNFFFSNLLMGYWTVSPKQQSTFYREKQIDLDYIFLYYFIEKQFAKKEIDLKTYKKLKNKIIKFKNYKYFYLLKINLNKKAYLRSLLLFFKILIKKTHLKTKLKSIFVISSILFGFKKFKLMS